LEALRLKTVPVVSSTTSLPEVVGQAGITVDPCSTNAIQRGLFKAVTLTDRRQTRYHQLGRAQVELFSGEQSARAVLRTILTAVPQHPVKDDIVHHLRLTTNSTGH